MNNVDIKYLLNDFNKYISYRLLNIYELDSKTIILKLSDKNEKIFIKMKSGYHLFATDSKPEDCPMIPGSFCAKLRKHLKNKRLEKIEQYGIDRIIDFHFGEGEYGYHIILELYSNGNIILTDKSYNILHLLRRYTDEDNGLILKVNEIYPSEKFRNIEYNKEKFLDWVKNIDLNENKKHSIKQLFTKGDSPLSKFGPVIVNHCLSILNINGNKKCKILNEIEDTLLEKIYDDIVTFTKHTWNKADSKGYIVLHNSIYSDYIPFKFNHYNDKELIEFNNFNDCLKQYFSHFKEEKKIILEDKKKKEKLGKVERAMFEINNRLTNFKNKIDNNNEQIRAINTNLDTISNLIKNYNKYIHKKKHDIKNTLNTWYSLICEYNSGFNGSEVESFLIFSNFYGITDYISEYVKDTVLKIQEIDEKNECLVLNYEDIIFNINWNISVQSNIRNIYDNKKFVNNKMKKTEIEGNKAIDRIKEKNLPEVKHKVNYEIIDKNFWFQKFNWFITSDKLLFICGKTAEQNEMVVKRYMNNNDIYIHGDFPGSPSGIIMNPENIEIPLHSKIQAGNFLVCNTKNWKERRVEKSYYVTKDQVSKSAPSGEYLTTGSFMIRGKKNYLPDSNLEMGIGMIFVIRNIEDNIIKSFVYSPKEDDDIIFCIPVCSSYRSLNEYKYKIKIKPGNQKKNKMIKSITEYFCKMKDCSDKEKYLMKNISNDYFHSILLNNSQTCISGFHKK